MRRRRGPRDGRPLVASALAAAALMAAACGSSSPSGAPGASTVPAGSPAPGSSSAGGPGASVPAGPDVPDVSGGPGGIPSPAAGLDALAAYRATLTLAFSGTQGGTRVDWSQTWTLTADRAGGLRVLAYGRTGLGDGPAPLPALQATDGTTSYTVLETGDACAASAVTAGAAAPRLPEPAAKLPRILSMTSAGDAPTVGGIEASAWTFTGDSVRSAGNATITGGATIARSGGLVLAYDLSIAGGHDVFDADTEGAYRWRYRLEPLDAAHPSALPADCPLALLALPLMADAQDVTREPGWLEYTTPVPIEDVEAFYEDAMPKAGFVLDGDPWLSGLGVSLRWTKDDRAYLVGIVDGSPVRVRIHETPTAAAAGPTPTPAPTTAADAAMKRVAASLTALLGTDTQPTALGSYHVVVHGDAPAWDGKVVRSTTDATGDVQGADVHFVVTTKAGAAKATRLEGYHVGGVDRAVKGGKVVDDLGMAYLAWVSWPIDAVSAIGIGSLRSEAAGTATIDGRAAEVYRVRGTAEDDPTGLLTAFGIAVRTTDGTVWVDAATGALLKADIAYVADVRQGSTTHGTAKGTLSIEVSKVGAVTVRMP